MTKDFEIHHYKKIKAYDYAGRVANGHSFVFKAQTKTTVFAIVGRVFDFDLPIGVEIYAVRNGKTKIVYPKYGTRFDNLLDRVAKDTAHLNL